MEFYDVVVIGGGPGGYVAAIRASQCGGKVAIIEKEKLGGTCLNRGCIPTKTLVKSAEIIHNIKNGAKHGISATLEPVNIKKLMDYKNAVTNQLSNGVKGLIASNDIKLYIGTARTTGENSIIINLPSGETEQVQYAKLIIATGSENLVPPIPGIDETILTSTEILNIEEIPKSLLIVGGGVIGCEFATIFSAFGTEVTIVEKMARVIPTMDGEMSAMLKQSLKMNKVKILLEHSVEKINASEGRYQVSIREEGTEMVLELEVEKVLISVGRTPNLEGLETLDLKMNGRYIEVDSNLRTSKNNVYAIGDVNGMLQLAHVASAQGMVAAENAMGAFKTCELGVVPSCVYTIPEIGSVGLTEENAKGSYREIIVGKFPVGALGKAMAMGETMGIYKVIADKETKKILGVHIMGTHATDVIMEAAAVMHNEGVLGDLANVIHAHPTMAEGLMEAAHDAEDLCIHMPKKGDYK